MDAVDELLQLDLVRTTDVPRRFRFRHPLVRRAIYEATPGGWRLGDGRLMCRGCGAPTAPRNGKGDAYAYCKRCHPGAIAPQWTRERVREAMRAW